MDFGEDIKKPISLNVEYCHVSFLHTKGSTI
jgi:hypothetical protein